MEKNFSPIKKRILLYADNKGYSKRKIYLDTGIANGVLDKESGLTEDNIEKFISTYKDVNIVWLLTGRGSMIKQVSKEYAENIDITTEPDLSYIAQKRIVPLVSMSVAAGFGSSDFTITEQDIEANYVVPDFNGIDFMIRVKGSSMYPKYSSGDIVACRKISDSKFIQWNKCHVIATKEQGLLVKRLKKGTTENSILAISDNKEYDPFEIPLDEITGIAIVVGVIRLE